MVGGSVSGVERGRRPDGNLNIDFGFNACAVRISAIDGGVTLFQAALEDVGAFVAADGGEVEFKRIAVTPEQIDSYDLPGAPPKASSHAATWRSDTDAVQAEAMAPSDLAAEIRHHVISELDMDALEQAKSGEAGNREGFDRMMSRIRGGT